MEALKSLMNSLRDTDDDFASEMEELTSAEQYVVKMVQNKDKAEVNDAVWKWLHDVDELKQRHRQMNERGNNKFFLSRVQYDLEKSYLQSKMLTKMTALNNKIKFLPLFVPLLPVPVLDPFSCENFEYFEYTKEASDQLFEALGEDSSHLIGLYGLRGCGKTKLVKAAGEKIRTLKIFDVIVFATVSQNPNIRKIQDEIADCLGLKLEENSEAGRARRIHSKLLSKEKILVIFDDVRAKLEVENIGIPYKGEHKGLKILLTTRSRQVCSLMECQREIHLHPLSQDEAWKLFKKHSGIDEENDESSSNLLQVARQVAAECEGLPGKIKDVGSSLRRKPIEEWEASLDSMRHSSARYQVFLSFRGDDTRYSFTGFLYQALCREGFKTFMDDGGLERGDQISESLIRAIEASRLSIIVLSENYAFSSWCLDELVTIIECKKTKNQLVWPIFYKVEPSDVRHQKNSYCKAMNTHAERFGNDSERVQKWRLALSEVAGLSGDHYTTGYQHEFIQMIVDKVNNIKNRLYIQSTDTN